MALGGAFRQPGIKLRNKFFHRYAKSWLLDPKLSVDTGFPKANEQPLFKTRVYLRRDGWRAALEGVVARWVGWEQVDSCWGASAEP